MGWNIGKDVAEGVVGGILAPIKDLISEFITDADKQQEIAYKIATLAQTQAHEQYLAQQKINEESAKHASIFVAGARPAAIWVGVAGLFLVLIFFPLTIFIYGIWGHEIEAPLMDTVTLFALLGPLLGLGGMRMVEKVKGVSRNNLKEIG